MRVLVQRVREASVTVDGRITGAIGAGLLLLVGIEAPDSRTDSEWLVKKISQLRIFNDDDGVMNRSLLVLSGGHPYEEGPFAKLLAALGDWDITHLIHPEGGEADAAEAIATADALLCYDMAGYTFANGTVTIRPPSPAFRDAITARFAAGKGAVALHHALAGWAEWPEWHEWVGGGFLYQPGEWRLWRGGECVAQGITD